MNFFTVLKTRIIFCIKRTIYNRIKTNLRLRLLPSLRTEKANHRVSTGYI